MDDVRARDVLDQPQAWPLRVRVDRLQRFCLLVPHNFAPDRLSTWLHGRSGWQDAYARPMRAKRDEELPAGLADTVAHDVMPQFQLRNIGRAERDNDPTAPLPLAPIPGLGGRPGAELAEVRSARVPTPQLADIWSLRLMGRVRASLRRIVREDPWALRVGAEATSDHAGPGHTFVAEGTHPDDLPDAWWGPETTRPPEVWHGPAPEPGDEPPAAAIFAAMRELTQ